MWCVHADSSGYYSQRNAVASMMMRSALAALTLLLDGEAAKRCHVQSMYVDVVMLRSLRGQRNADTIELMSSGCYSHRAGVTDCEQRSAVTVRQRSADAMEHCCNCRWRISPVVVVDRCDIRFSPAPSPSSWNGV